MIFLMSFLLRHSSILGAAARLMSLAISLAPSLLVPWASVMRARVYSETMAGDLIT